MSLPLFALFIAALPAQQTRQPLTQGEAPRQNWIVRAERVYTATGRAIKDGAVLVNGSKIGAVGPGAAEENGKYTLSVYAVTPGMIDASVRLGPGTAGVEQSREVTPELRIADALDLFDVRWDRQAESGVTTALVCPQDENVIGGLGIALKTAGKPTVKDRTLKADAVLRGSMGSQPSTRNSPAFQRPRSFYNRRPTTRMGVEWEWRKSFYEAVAGKNDPARALPGSAELLRALDGKLTLSIQAWTTQDIRTAVFLKEELEQEPQIAGKPRVFVDAAAEAWKEPELLVRSKVGVVLPPFPVDGRTGEGSFMAWNVAKLLCDENVPVAFSAHGGSGPLYSLASQAGYAMQGGLEFDKALAAVTSVPARFLGVEDRVGTLEVGKDADLALWNGEPFQPTSRVIGVIIDGALVLDPRPTDAR
jgi:imidazolonepropionase-like amidohydrolase